MTMHNRFIILIVCVACSAVGGKRQVCLAADSSTADLRRQISAALATAFPKAAGQRRVQAEECLRLYTSAAALPSADRARFQLRLRSRLSRLANAIRKDLQPSSDAPAASAKGASSSAVPPESSASAAASGASKKPGGAAGGGPQDDGQALVDLIEATIAPESWDVNGGAGTIRYWPAWHALVVRQTDEVHEQIGGVVHAMRK